MHSPLPLTLSARNIGIALHNCAMTEEAGLGLYRIVLRFPDIDRMHEMGRLLVAARTLARETADTANCHDTLIAALKEAEVAFEGYAHPMRDEVLPKIHAALALAGGES